MLPGIVSACFPSQQITQALTKISICEYLDSTFLEIENPHRAIKRIFIFPVNLLQYIHVSKSEVYFYIVCEFSYVFVFVGLA